MKTNRKAYAERNKELAYKDDIEVWEDITALFTASRSNESYSLHCEEYMLTNKQTYRITIQHRSIFGESPEDYSSSTTFTRGIIITQAFDYDYFDMKTDNLYYEAQDSYHGVMFGKWPGGNEDSFYISLKSPDLIASEVAEIIKIERRA